MIDVPVVETVKLFALVAVPHAVVTEMGPDEAPPGTATTKLVAVADETVAFVPLNATVLLAGVVLKFVPVIVTDAPTAPVAGVNDVIVGAMQPFTVKLFALVAVIPFTVTVIFPVVAPAGTVVVIDVAVLAVTTAVVPLKFTVLFGGVVLKLVPVIVTVAPMLPLAGVKLMMVGVGGVPTVNV